MKLSDFSWAEYVGNQHLALEPSLPLPSLELDMHRILKGCCSVPVSCVPLDGGEMVLAVVVSIDPHCCEHSTEQMYHSLLLRQLGDSQFGAIMNSAALNGLGCVVWCGRISISGGSSPRGGILGLYMLSFRRRCWTVLLCSFTSSCSHQ